ncbi:MAG: L-serine ammonia-lyase, iron-sulfur-dependent subunit beta [Cyanobacteria bacterium RUI128]|nr:L-serine ammonia-lyase, iron-sulfur-dependent subunit beta [Cyanobacteria bacterium RUI128]
MNKKTLFDVISPIMVGPSSSHTAGAIRLGLMARNIYSKPVKKVLFRLYNSFAQTGLGHGTQKGLLAGVLGYGVSDTNIKNIFDIVKDVEYEFEYADDLSRHPNSVDININDEMKISGESVGAGEIKITSINGFSVSISGNYHTILLMYKDKPGMISTVSNIIQSQNINIASLHCDRNEKGGTASMYIALDVEASDNIVNIISGIDDVYYTTQIRKLEV